MTTKSPQSGAVEDGVRRLLRRGLPVTADPVAPVLLDLRGVIARAADPSDSASRAAALDALMRTVLARFADVKYAQAVRALFGLGEAAAGLNLTERRTIAASASGHEGNHFRKRVEPRLIAQVAAELLADTDQFTRSTAVAPRLTAPRGRSRIPADPLAWEVTEQEEALTRLWGAVYALRAELLKAERLISVEVDPSETTACLTEAAWRWGSALDLASAYCGAFDSEETAESLVALAGWFPSLTADETECFRGVAEEARTAREFRSAVAEHLDLTEVWVKPFLTRVSEPTVERTTS